MAAGGMPWTAGTQPVGKVLVRAHITADVLTGLRADHVRGDRRWWWVRATCWSVSPCCSPPASPTCSTARWPRRRGTASVRGAFFDSVADRSLRRLPLRRRGLVSRRAPPRRDGAGAVRHLGRHVAHLVPAGQGRVARTVGQGRAHGARRAFHPAGLVLHRRRHLGLGVRAGLVGVPRAVVGHRRRAIRERVERGRRAAARRCGPGRVRRRRHGRHPSGTGPLARRSGGLPLARVARGPCTS